MSSSNNPINNTVGALISGVTNTLTVTNSSNTASSSAREIITVGGSSASDSSINFNISAIEDWEIGIDNSDSDSFKLSLGSALGTQDTIHIYQSGEFTQPRNCRFTATVSATITNVTGDNTPYTIIFDTEIVDTGNNYNPATGLFTAPVDGVYFLSATIGLIGITVAMNQTNFVFTINGGTLVYQPSSLQSVGVHNPDFGLVGTVILRLTAGDTAGVRINISGGARVVDVDASGYPNQIENIFSGILLG